MFEAIVLAGGLGTRLREVVKDVPKPMAPVGDKPFLYYIMSYLKNQDVNRIILAVSYKKESIINYFGNNFCGIQVLYSIEQEPLGTGGGIKKALQYTDSQDVFVVNGDTYFCIDLKDFFKFHSENNADVTIALKHVDKAVRYGIVKISDKGEVLGFLEKKENSSGFVNGGMYLINKKRFNEYTNNYPENFSFEKDILVKKEMSIFAKVYSDYFIDIGVPEDYEKFCKESKIKDIN